MTGYGMIRYSPLCFHDRSASQHVVETLKTTLGPRGMDKLIHLGKDTTPGPFLFGECLISMHTHHFVSDFPSYFIPRSLIDCFMFESISIFFYK